MASVKRRDRILSTGVCCPEAELSTLCGNADLELLRPGVVRVEAPPKSSVSKILQTNGLELCYCVELECHRSGAKNYLRG